MNAPTDLTEWIQKHKVCWDLLPYYAVDGGPRIQIGFELDLFAQHLPSVVANPGCKECENVYKNLAQIARKALPTEFRPTKYEIQQFDASFHIRRETNLKTEIQVTVLIIHREGLFDPVNECERKCADEIEKHLKNMGVQRKVWLQRTAPTTEGSRKA
jgi:hypothetical protein